ncbi:putative protease inhibitor 4 [Danaus plexippus plexippus]|uniref:Protease inhibitor 4 n=2 Tax=Danaus plexippus TaxID=13037 RepID=A0A212F3T1_DANPL|nr:putative protease inhibitor 4 [Danaus plexippus plexippus]
MKSVFILCLIAFLGLTLAETTLYPRGCIYALGKCVRECEVGTHAYTTGCGYLTPEATCENPKPTTDMRARICDYSACYCDPPTVRNKVNNKCVPLEECPKEAETAAPRQEVTKGEFVRSLRPPSPFLIDFHSRS